MRQLDNPRVVIAASILLIAQTAAAASGAAADRIVNAAREPQNWLTTGRTYDESRDSPLARINAGNAKDLGLVWYYDLDTDRGQESTPLAVDGVLYTTSAWSKVQAFDAATGKLLWQFDPEVPRKTGVKSCCDSVNRGAAYWNGKVYVGTIDGRLIAIDAKSGKQVWSTLTVDQSKSYTIDGAPRVIKGRVIIGNAGADYAVRGYVSAYDAETGKLDWRFYTVPGEPGKKDGAASDAILEKLAAPTWSGKWWSEAGGGGGATVWDAMAYDPDLDLLYVATGNADYWNKAYRSPGDSDDLFVASIIALRPETGAYVWHFQETPGDEWDYDATQNMILADLEIGGGTRKVLMQASKNGYFYVLDRATGKLVSAKPFVPLNWSAGIDPDTGRPKIVPDARYDKTGKRWDAMPGGIGGHNWQPMSFSKETGLVYIPAQELGGVYVTDKDFKPRPIGANLGIDFTQGGLPDDPKQLRAIRANMKGYLLAWDPVNQKEAWRATHPDYYNGGVLATAGGIVIQGDNDGFLNIYDARTGGRLWSFDGGSAILAAPITYEVQGKQYVSVLAGYGGSSGLYAGEGNWGPDGPRRNKSRVLTFALGGTAKLPPRQIVTITKPQPPAQFADAATIAEGGRHFAQSCLYCHGGSAESAGVLPDLRHSALLASRESWLDVVGKGVLSDHGMASFAAAYSPAEIDSIRAYVIDRAWIEKRMDERR
ncbi:MAG TPA: PQQ-dependent dehydrogenase, methanol/ethanol family [Alphaproteobacteria bacterium]|nr:PQQ-dependent dehydrogenase, methanol/ethanol family [Alphaproteobacteria bacterium]